MGRFDDAIGLDRLKVIHLNDSKTELESRVDPHAPIGEGKLRMQVFHAIVRDRRFRSTPKVLELPKRDAKLVQQQLERALIALQMQYNLMVFSISSRSIVLKKGFSLNFSRSISRFKLVM